MRKSSRSVGFSSLILFWGIFFAASIVRAETILIDFDTDPFGAPVSNGTILNSVYSTLGVTFEKVGPGTICGEGPSVYANNNRPGGFGSSPNTVSTCDPPTASDISETSFGMIHANLTKPAAQVCIDVRPDGAEDFAALRSFDAFGNVLDSATSEAGVTGPLCVTGSRIYQVRFSGGGEKFARFDNLSVTFATPNLWTALLSLKAKLTVLEEDGSGNSKFSNASVTWTGTIALPEVDGVPTGVKFFAPGDALLFDIKAISYLAANSAGNKPDKFLLTGTGDTFLVDGVIVKGPVSLDAKGTLKYDDAGKIISITLSGKIRGGAPKTEVSGSFKATLTPS
jgi:hypothetical protein